MVIEFRNESEKTSFGIRNDDKTPEVTVGG